MNMKQILSNCISNYFNPEQVRKTLLNIVSLQSLCIAIPGVISINVHSLIDQFIIFIKCFHNYTGHKKRVFSCIVQYDRDKMRFRCFLLENILEPNF